jgi:hypothetical protein
MASPFNKLTQGEAAGQLPSSLDYTQEDQVPAPLAMQAYHALMGGQAESQPVSQAALGYGGGTLQVAPELMSKMAAVRQLVPKRVMNAIETTPQTYTAKLVPRSEMWNTESRGEFWPNSQGGQIKLLETQPETAIPSSFGHEITHGALNSTGNLNSTPPALNFTPKMSERIANSASAPAAGGEILPYAVNYPHLVEAPQNWSEVQTVLNYLRQVFGASPAEIGMERNFARQNMKATAR